MASNVAEFYRNKNIFITGGTGFLGVALIDKLLRSCPDVSRIASRIGMCYTRPGYSDLMKK